MNPAVGTVTPSEQESNETIVIIIIYFQLIFPLYDIHEALLTNCRNKKGIKLK